MNTRSMGPAKRGPSTPVEELDSTEAKRLKIDMLDDPVAADDSDSDDTGTGAGPVQGLAGVETLGAGAGDAGNGVGAGAAPGQPVADAPVRTHATGAVAAASGEGSGIFGAARTEVDEERQSVMLAMAGLNCLKNQSASAVLSCGFFDGGDAEEVAMLQMVGRKDSEFLQEQQVLWEQCEEEVRRDRAAFRASVEGPGAAAHEKLAQDAGAAGASEEEISEARQALNDHIREWQRKEFVAACGNRGAPKVREGLRGASWGGYREGTPSTGRVGTGVAGMHPLGGFVVRSSKE